MAHRSFSLTRIFALLVLCGAALAIGDDPVELRKQVPAPGDVPPDAGRQLIVGGFGLAPGGPVRNRYGTLLRLIDAPKDRTTFGDFYDYGYWPGTSYQGQNDLPPGYWVYLATNWYIFKDNLSSGGATPAVPRQWGPEQATGAPDTWPRSGDIGTAWASKTPDGQEEWLQLCYTDPIHPAAVLVYETYNPGALVRITAVGDDGKESELWSGVDPTPKGTEKGISVVPVHPQSDVKSIRLYLDSPHVAGWNEIDAVGLVDETGKTHWATSATASSTYADNSAPLLPATLDRLSDR